MNIDHMFIQIHGSLVFITAHQTLLQLILIHLYHILDMVLLFKVRVSCLKMYGSVPLRLGHWYCFRLSFYLLQLLSLTYTKRVAAASARLAAVCILQHASEANPMILKISAAMREVTPWPN